VELLDKLPLGTDDLQVPPGGMTVAHIRCVCARARAPVRMCCALCCAVTDGRAQHALRGAPLPLHALLVHHTPRCAHRTGRPLHVDLFHLGLFLLLTMVGPGAHVRCQGRARRASSAWQHLQHALHTRSALPHRPVPCCPLLLHTGRLCRAAHVLAGLHVWQH
jgi:hypothetical protein